MALTLFSPATAVGEPLDDMSAQPGLYFGARRGGGNRRWRRGSDRSKRGETLMQKICKGPATASGERHHLSASRRGSKEQMMTDWAAHGSTSSSGWHRL